MIINHNIRNIIWNICALRNHKVKLSKSLDIIKNSFYQLYRTMCPDIEFEMMRMKFDKGLRMYKAGRITSKKNNIFLYSI